MFPVKNPRLRTIHTFALESSAEFDKHFLLVASNAQTQEARIRRGI